MFGLVTVALLSIVLGFWFGWRRKKLNFFKDLGIPGPEPNIVFGNLWEIYKKDPIQSTKEWLAKYGSVFGYYVGLEPVLVVGDLELMKQVLVKKFNSFTDRPTRLFNLRNEERKNATNLISMGGQRWKEVRSLLTPAFTTGKLKKMAPLMSSALRVLEGKIQAKSVTGEEFEIYDLYKGLTMDVIGRTAFGIEARVQDNTAHPLLRTSKIIMSRRVKSLLYVFSYSLREFGQIFYRLMGLVMMWRNKGVNPIIELMQTCDQVIGIRKNDPSLRRPDLLQTMIDACSDGPHDVGDLVSSVEADESSTSELSTNPAKTLPRKTPLKLLEKEITGNALVFFLAGFETTSTALAFITHVLVNRQDVQDLLRREILTQIPQDEVVDYDSVQKLHYMDRVIMECLRLYPPVYSFVNRLAVEDVQLDKWSIPKDTAVQIPVVSLHRDPNLWSQPEKFDPDRFLPENRSSDHSMIWQPFGAGPRNCIGMRFAMTEMKLALALMISKYTFLPTANTEGEKHLQIRISQNTIHPENGIFVKVVPAVTN